MSLRKIEMTVIALVALHSVGLGILMLVLPHWTLEFAGWDYDGPRFFPAQSGIFLLILAGAYFAGIRWRPFAWFLVASKAAAVLFLIAESLIGGIPLLVLAAAFFDALMGGAVAGIVVLNLRAEGSSMRLADLNKSENGADAPGHVDQPE